MKLDAQRRLFKEVIGKNNLLSAIDRDKARKLLDILKVLPASTTKRFKGKTAPEVACRAEEKRLAPMSVTTANSYMSAFVSLVSYAVAEGLIAKNPATGRRLASDGVRRKDKRLPFIVANLQAHLRSAALHGLSRRDLPAHRGRHRGRGRDQHHLLSAPTRTE